MPQPSQFLLILIRIDSFLHNAMSFLVVSTQRAFEHFFELLDDALLIL